jgi:PAS domain S-box-containing protein
LAELYDADDKEVMNTRQRKQVEEQWGGKGEKRVWLETIKSPIYDESGEVIGTSGIAREITRRRLAEQAVRESEKHYRTLFEGASEGIIAADAETKRLLFANPAICKMLGYSEVELKQMSVSDIHHKDDFDKVLSEFEALRSGSKALATDLPCLCKDGRILYMDVGASRVEIDGKECLVGFFADITERKKVEQAVQDSEERYRRLVESLRREYFFYSHGLDGVFKYISPSIENVLGYTQQRFLTHYTEYLTDNPINKHVVELTNMSIQGKQQPPYEVEIYHKDGSIHRLEVSEAPIFDVNKQVIAVEGIAHDITDRWQAKMQLQKARDELELRVKQRTAELEKANWELLEYQRELRSLASELSLAEERLRRRVASNVHDNVGQSLAISKLKVEALRESLDKPELIESLDEIKRLLGDAIDKTRSLTAELSPPVLYELGFEASLEWLVKNAREQYGLSAQFEDDGIDKPVREDIRVILFQAVRELLVNVAKHSQAREVIVRVCSKADKIHIDVEDNGKGFDILKERPHNVASGGFGLFSIRERLGHMGGSFDIESKPDHGTCISLTAPLTA